MNHIPFGSANHHYQSEISEVPSHTHDSSYDSMIEKIVLSQFPDMKERVERAFKQWNGIIRDQLRAEMGLRLTIGNDHRSIPVYIADGLPPTVRQGLYGFDPTIVQLLFNKGRLETTGDGVGYIFHNLEKIARVIPPHRGDIDESLRSCYQYVESILQEVGRLDILRTILSADHDVLGAYYFNGPFINIYWLAIGIAAGGLGVTPEGLAVVVAAHELAHAYSHLGRDIDLEAWDTAAFAYADVHIVEGIAQYYTQAVCSKLKDRMPYAMEAFEKLLGQQSKPYTCHRDWNLPAKSFGEVVRVSMISCRSREITDYGGFCHLLQQHSDIKAHRAR